MSAERDKSILIGSAFFVLGFGAGVSFLIWVLNRDVPDKDEIKTPSPTGSFSKKNQAPIDSAGY